MDELRPSDSVRGWPSAPAATNSGALEDATQPAFFAAVRELVCARQRFFAWDAPGGRAFVAVPASAPLRRQRPPAHSRGRVQVWAEPFDRRRSAPGSAWAAFVDTFHEPWRIITTERPAPHAAACAPSSDTPLAGATQWPPHDGVADIDTVWQESQTAFEARVAAIAAACRARGVQKIVVARACSTVTKPGRRWDVTATMAALRAAAPGCTLFAMSDGAGRVFMGATPELLAEARDGVVRTTALAGTRSTDERGAAAAASELLASAKDRHEHDVVAEAIERALRPVTSSLSRAAQPRVRHVPGMCHLETPIRGRLLAGVGIREVVRRLHPTPAVCGAPRDAALRWLRDSEPLERGLYAGHIGWQSADGQGASAVAIRSLLIDGRVAHAFAGAGVVAESEPAAEWRETCWKLRLAQGALRWAECDDV